jgi:hypothetical protein
MSKYIEYILYILFGVFAFFSISGLICGMIWDQNETKTIQSNCSKFCGKYVVENCSKEIIICGDFSMKYKGKDYKLQGETNK